MAYASLLQLNVAALRGAIASRAGGGAVAYVDPANGKVHGIALDETAFPEEAATLEAALRIGGLPAYCVREFADPRFE